jgi:hypothetical protein
MQWYRSCGGLETRLWQRLAVALTPDLLHCRWLSGTMLGGWGCLSAATMPQASAKAAKLEHCLHNVSAQVAAPDDLILCNSFTSSFIRSGFAYSGSSGSSSCISATAICIASCSGHVTTTIFMSAVHCALSPWRICPDQQLSKSDPSDKGWMPSATLSIRPLRARRL